MNRDMDLIRKILFVIEENPEPIFGKEINLDGYSSNEINFHIMLLYQAGLINAIDVSTLQDISWIPTHITWNGYEFLNAARDDKRWNQAKEFATKLGGFVFEVVKSYLLKLMIDKI